MPAFAPTLSPPLSSPPPPELFTGPPVWEVVDSADEIELLESLSSFDGSVIVVPEVVVDVTWIVVLAPITFSE